jgi:hypothetical protein
MIHDKSSSALARTKKKYAKRWMRTLTKTDGNPQTQPNATPDSEHKMQNQWREPQESKLKEEKKKKKKAQ